jgi:hypothetical protein
MALANMQYEQQYGMPARIRQAQFEQQYGDPLRQQQAMYQMQYGVPLEQAKAQEMMQWYKTHPGEPYPTSYSDINARVKAANSRQRAEGFNATDAAARAAINQAAAGNKQQLDRQRGAVQTVIPSQGTILNPSDFPPVTPSSSVIPGPSPGPSPDSIPITKPVGAASNPALFGSPTPAPTVVPVAGISPSPVPSATPEPSSTPAVADTGSTLYGPVIDPNTGRLLPPSQQGGPSRTTPEEGKEQMRRAEAGEWDDQQGP